MEAHFIKTVGIIAEYNPFHNGHLYQLSAAAELYGAKNIIAVMSGSFVQRGEPAICNKWARAAAAVKSGVSLVIELPCVYSCQTAEIFALGAVRLLASLGIVDALCFGTENGDVGELVRCAQLLNNESNEFKTVLSRLMENGTGYPAARTAAINELYGIDLNGCPNKLLGIEYARALLREKSGIALAPVIRRGCGHDKEGSASHVRQLIFEGESISGYVPQATADIINEETKNGRAPNRLEQLSDAVLYRLRSVAAAELASIAEVSEGMENRLIKAAYAAGNIDELFSLLASKRYSNARLRRMVLNALLNIKKEDIIMPPSYIRVLAGNERGRELLRQISRRCSLPIITKTADAEMNSMLLKDIFATSVYSLCYENAKYRNGNGDYFNSPVF